LRRWDGRGEYPQQVFIPLARLEPLADADDVIALDS